MKNSLVIKPKFIVDENGRKKAVIISCSAYERLMEDLEDLRDVAMREKEPSRLFSQYHKERMKRK